MVKKELNFYKIIIMSNFIKKTLNNLIEDFCDDEENKNKIYENLLTPLMDNFLVKINPYINLIIGMYVLNLLLIIAILIIIILTRNIKN
jgi:hypothetical protein